MVVLLGGRVAEQLVFGAITTGASDDLRKVHEISRSMITEYGMGTRADVEAAAGRRLLDVRPHAPQVRRGAAVPDRPGAPPRAPAGRARTARCSRRWRTRCSRTRCSSARTSSASWGTTGTAVAAATRTAIRAASCRWPSRARPASRRLSACATTRLRRLIRPVFGRIDHIGVAVEDLDEAIALYCERLGMPLQHRETVEEQGVEAVLLGVGDEPRRAAAAARAGHGGRQVPRAQRPGPAPRGVRDRRHRAALERCAPPACG